MTGTIAPRASEPVGSRFETPDHRRRPGRDREAWELGRRHGGVDLEFEAQGYVGLMLVQSGRVEEGLMLFDKVLAAIQLARGNLGLARDLLGGSGRSYCRSAPRCSFSSLHGHCRF